jgi:hypothetical protein
MTVLLFTVACFVGCESTADRLRESDAQSRVREAKQTLSLGAMGYNLDVCYKHLGVTYLTADNSMKWRRFKADHHITGSPNGLSDADLKDCLAVK